jgi:outer membrane protein insertion porin family
MVATATLLALRTLLRKATSLPPQALRALQLIASGLKRFGAATVRKRFFVFFNDAFRAEGTIVRYPSKANRVATVERHGSCPQLVCTTALLLCFSWLLVIPNPLQGQTPEAASKWEGRSITKILFDPADQPYPQEQMLSILLLKQGAKFSDSTLRQSIQALYSTGRFADIAVDASDAEPDQGVILKFITTRAYFVGRVTVEGVKEPPNEGQLVSATKLQLGLPYADNDRVSAIESIGNLLLRNGFYHATVTADTRFEEATEQASLTFLVDTGKRAHYERPIITGTPNRSIDSVVRSTRWKRLYGLLGWYQVTDTRTQQGVDNVRSYYQKKDLLLSRVVLRGLEYHEQTATVQPTLQVTAGPEVIIHVEGANLRKGKLRQLVPIYQERTVDADLLVEGQHRIEQYFQSEGYFEASVSYVSERQNGRRIITYDVDKGPRHRLASLRITGNKYFTLSTIMERMITTPVRFPRFPYGRYSATTLNGDLQAIRDLYQTNGFRDVKVDYSVKDNYKGKINALSLTISIDEGPQSYVSEVAIDGVPATDAQYLKTQLISAKGQPYSQANVAADRDLILNYFYNSGYPNATFDYYLDSVSIPNRVKLRFKLTLGKREYVRQVLVSGLNRTKPRLVYDRIKLTEGDPLSLTKMTDTQRSLYDLGIFARVNTAIQNPDGEEANKYVLLQLEEASRYSVTVGVGAQLGRFGTATTSLNDPGGTTGFAPSGSLGVSRINFLGIGHTLSLTSTVSTLEQLVGLTYFAPQFIGHEKLNLTLNALYDNSNDINTYTARRRQFSAQLGQKVSRAFTIQYRFVFRYVTQSNLKIDPNLVPLLSQPDKTGLFGVSFVQDRRDNPLDPTHGVYSSIDLAYAAKFLGSQTQFGRLLLRNSTYARIGKDLVFARSTQFGVIIPVNASAIDIPLPERFFSGGATTLRSFPENQAGPRDTTTGFPLGGNALLINNLELRFPLFGDNLRGVLFEDAGNVYQSFSDISFGFRQPSLQNFNYMVQAVGIGFRYRTPIGPVRVDFSFSPDAPRFNGFKGTEQELINCSAAGTCVSTVQKINAFQFHFSLGQAF